MPTAIDYIILGYFLDLAAMVFVNIFIEHWDDVNCGRKDG